jgi:hypothetical protein
VRQIVVVRICLEVFIALCNPLFNPLVGFTPLLSAVATFWISYHFVTAANLPFMDRLEIHGCVGSAMLY